MKPLLVGESNPYSRAPEDALLPWPRGAAGDRLRVQLEFSDSQYLHAFDRENLLHRGERFSVPLARERAKAILEAADGRPLVLLGAKVAAAFGVDTDPFKVHQNPAQGPGKLFVLPHPSGRSRRWNDPEAAAQARELLAPILRGTSPPATVAALTRRERAGLKVAGRKAGKKARRRTR